MGMLLLDYPIDAQALAYSVCFARHIIKKVQKKISKTLLGDLEPQFTLSLIFEICGLMSQFQVMSVT